MIVIAKLEEVKAGEVNMAEALSQTEMDDDEEIFIPDEQLMKNGGIVQVQLCKVNIQKLVAVDHQKLEFTAYHYLY